MADDDALMDRFEKNSQRFRARDAIITVFVAAFVLVLIQGRSMKHTGEQLSPGWQRDVVLAVAKPSGWVGKLLPLHHAAHELTAGLSPDQELAKTGGFDQAPAAGAAGAGAANAVPLVTPDAFDPASIGAKPDPKIPLKTLVVAGDSLSQLLAPALGRALAPKGVKVVQDFKLGTGISKTDLLDWGRLAVTEKEKDKPDAVIMFMGANEGFPMKNAAGKDIPCCGAEWAAIYANRARQMMNTYRAGGKTHVYWLTIPAQQKSARQAIAKVVNAALRVAAEPYGRQVTIFDTIPTFSPGGKYKAAIPVGGKDTIIRQPDGIHLNEAGSKLLSQIMVQQLQTGFTF